MKSWVSDMGFEDTPMVPSPLVVPRHWGFNPTSPWPLPIYIYIYIYKEVGYQTD